MSQVQEQKCPHCGATDHWFYYPPECPNYQEYDDDTCPDCGVEGGCNSSCRCDECVQDEMEEEYIEEEDDLTA